MNNLIAIAYERWERPVDCDDRRITATAWDLAHDAVLCCFGPDGKDASIELVRIYTQTGKHEPITSWEAPCPNPDVLHDEILSLHYFGESLTSCLVLAGGDIVVVREESTTGQDSIEIVGSVDAGIAAAAWSPDEELLCIVSKADTVIYMSRTFEGITDITISAQDLSISKHVSVGWGKKETQFKGRGARALQDPTMPEYVDEGVLSANDDGSTRVSWRGDGAFVAVTKIEQGKRRVIRVYSRDGALDSVSEPVDGLEGALSWRPSGNLIAGIQRRQDRVDVVFFERNGLRHGEFTLRPPHGDFDQKESIRLDWNAESTILAITRTDSVELWTMSNYAWYLKQTIAIEANGAKISTMWHPELSLRLFATNQALVKKLEYISVVTRASTHPPHDFGSTAVVDGRSVHVTPYRFANVPPPMALHLIEVESNVVDVAFNTDQSLMAVLQYGGISIYELQLRKSQSAQPRQIGYLSTTDLQLELASQILFSAKHDLYVLDRTGSASVLHHFTLSTEDGRVDIRPLSDSFGSSDQQGLLNASATGTQHARSPITVSPLNTPLVAISPVESSSSPTDGSHIVSPDSASYNHPNGQSLASPSNASSTGMVSPLTSPRDAASRSSPNTQRSALSQKRPCDASQIFMLGNFYSEGQVHAVAQDKHGWLCGLSDTVASTGLPKFPTSLPWFESAQYGSTLTGVGLTRNGHLYANSRLLVKNCTSFALTQAHIVFTTTNHLLKMIHMTDPEGMEVPPDSPELDERCRTVERGAKIVTVIPSTMCAVLQMPRGNLETIYPRALVIAGIRKAIEEKDYRRAFMICRTQRVDMNILHDYAPAQFLASTAMFLEQVKKTTYIDLFLSSLREEDVTTTIYADSRSSTNSMADSRPTDTNSPGTDSTKSKVNRICDAVLEVLTLSRDANLQNIITAQLCKCPPAIEDALRVVAQVISDDAEDDLAEHAVEHVCFLADVKQLYQAALGMYNLDLALVIAQKSQEDPREYLPFLQKLQEMDDLRRRFSIDDHLGRNVKALNSLHALDATDEVLAYVQRFSLYQVAMALYRYKPNELESLTMLYARFLESKSQMKEAALAYESLHEYEKAASCYLASGSARWRETLSCAMSQSPPVAGAELKRLAGQLYDGLHESKDHFAAATIQLEYLDSVEASLKSYCTGYLFADAIHVALRQNRSDLLTTIIDPGLGDAFAGSNELLADCRSQLQAQVPRIRELREKARNDPLAFYEGERAGDGDLPDDVSIAASSRLSTSNSLFTRYTNKGGSVGTLGSNVSRATSKNRRREERKRARGKKGSVYEEEYLVMSVGRLIERVERTREEVDRLIWGLVRRGMLERARAIEANLVEVLDMCRACVPEVYKTEEQAVPVPSDATAATGAEGEAYLFTPVGGDAVLMESLQAASKPKDIPVVADFKRLSLLGS